MKPIARHLARLSIALALALLTACAGIGGGTPPPGGAGGGVLRVEVEGVPGRVGANVLVSGPDGFSKRVSAGLSVFSDIPLGAYEIVAFGVTDVAQSDSGYTPLESSFLVQVDDATGASVLVEYEALQAVASDRSRPMDADTAALLVGAESRSLQRFSAGEALEESGGTLRFASSNAYLDALEIGDVITVGVTPVTPQGFLGTVLSVRSESDGTIVVDAEPATLEDAVEQGVLAYSATLSPTDVVSMTTYYDGIDPLGVPDGMLPSDISFSFCPIAKKVNLLQDSRNELELDGSLCFALDVDFSASVLPWRPTELSFVATVRETAKIELTGNANLPAFDRTFPLVDYRLKPFSIPVAGVPVTLTPVITVSVTATGSLVASFHTAVEQSLTFNAGLRYRNGEWEHVRPQLRPTFSHTPLTYDAGLQVTAGVRSQLALHMYGVVGPTLAMTVSARADVTPFTQPAWRLLFGFDVRAGVEFKVFDFIDLSYEAALFAREWQVAQGEGGLRAPPAIDSFLASPRSIQSGDATTLSWSLSGGAPTSASISPGVGSVAGRSSVTVRPTTATTYTLSVANDAGVVTSSATVSVAAPSVTVSISPTSASLAAGESRSFSASVSGAQDSSVTWSTTCGSISGTGNTVTYTAPATASTCAVTARSVADTSKSAVATVTVTPAAVVSVSVQPGSATLPVNGTQSFTATVTGATNTNVTWSATCGSFSGTGNTVTYTAPATASTCAVTARSVADTSKSASATVTVTTAPPPGNRDPVIHAFFPDPQQPIVGQTVRLRWSISDPDGDRVLCTVSFGDGTSRTVSDCLGTTSVTHAYAAAGHHSASLVVVDGRGASAFAFATVPVGVPPSTNRPPAIHSFTVSLSSSTAPATATFRWNVSDPDNDRLSCLVSFGDEGGAHSGLITDCRSTTRVTHTYASPGNYTATIAVMDPGSLKAAATVGVRLAAAVAVPVITSISPATPNASWSGQNVRINGSGFSHGAGVVLHELSSGAYYDVAAKAQFVSSTRIDLTNIVFGTPAGGWRVMVRNDPSGTRKESNWFQFSTK